MQKDLYTLSSLCFQAKMGLRYDLCKVGFQKNFPKLDTNYTMFMLRILSVNNQDMVVNGANTVVEKEVADIVSLIKRL